MGKQVKMLEHHTDMLPVQVDIGFGIRDILYLQKESAPR